MYPTPTQRPRCSGLQLALTSRPLCLSYTHYVNSPKHRNRNQNPPAPIHVFSVYLPSRSGCTDAFREALDLLNATMDTLPSISYTIILGDLNADPGSHGGPLSTTRVNEQGRILSQYLSLWNFVSAHLHKSNLSSSHIFESEAHSTVSTIDHILCHQSFSFQDFNLPAPYRSTPSIHLTICL